MNRQFKVGSTIKLDSQDWFVMSSFVNVDRVFYILQKKGEQVKREVPESVLISQGNKPNHRTIVQIACCYAGSGDAFVYALADDGTAWELSDGGTNWRALPELPS